MDNALPPLPADLWPQVYSARASHPKGKMVSLEIPGLSENLLLAVLARAIHLEMRAAGEWAARVGTPSDKEYPSARSFSRYRAENAARLLTLYTSLFAATQSRTTSDQTPEALRAAASTSYQRGVRDTRDTLTPQTQQFPPAAALPEQPPTHFSARR